MNFTNTFFNDIIHLLYPQLCAGCGSDLVSKNQLLCLECISEMPVTGFYAHLENPVEKIFRGRLPLVTASAFAYFNKDSVVQHLLHQLKYQGRKDIGKYMGQLMGEKLKTSPWYKDIHAVIPLPLYISKKKKRGYNQAEMICDGISSIMNIPVVTDAVARKRYTDTQTHKTRLERWKNIESKFELKNSGAIMNKHVLLVDDVITTGATFESCGIELLKTEGLRLSVAAFAYTTL